MDADHLPLRAASGAGQKLARRLIREAADRSLFTLDPHFCFYGGDPTLMSAMGEGRVADVEAAFRVRFSPGARKDLAARYVGKRFRIPDPAGRKDHAIVMSASELADCAVRFQEPLDAIEDACAEIRRVKGGTPFAIEVSVDEVPGMSEPHHFYYLCAELARRNIRAFSLAPGLGFSKLDVDVKDPEGAFATRVRILAGISKHFGAVMGIHSGDGKSVPTRRILAKATGGNFWYKISPDRQRNFFRSLGLSAPGSEGRQLFQEVYRSALARVIGLAASGSNETARVARQTLCGRGDGSGALPGDGARDHGTAPRAAGSTRGRLAGPGEADGLGLGSAGARGSRGSHRARLRLRDGERAGRRGRFRLRGRFFALPRGGAGDLPPTGCGVSGHLTGRLGLGR